MPYLSNNPNDLTYRCECGNIFELPRDATRCPCSCHDEMLKKAKDLGLYCEDCGFSTLEPTTFSQHFGWVTHQRAVAAKSKRS